MNFLLDTNAVSEWVKPRPNPGLMNWMQSADEDRIFISAVTLAEMSYSLERLSIGRRRSQLERWLQHDLPLRFENRILPIDERVAQAWGVTISKGESRGRPIGVIDGFIAATAEIHDLTLITRNTSDFHFLTLVLSPWT